MAVARKPKAKTKPDRGVDDAYWQTRGALGKKVIHLFSQVIYRSWCKACGLCIAFCPTNIYGREEAGRPVAENPDACIGCRLFAGHPITPASEIMELMSLRLPGLALAVIFSLLAYNKVRFGFFM